MDKTEIIGSWSFPDLGETNYVGTLKREGDSIKLTLIGCFTVNVNEVDLIHGLSTDGKRYTLYKARVSNRTFSAPGIPTIVFSIIYCLVGDCLNANELNFNSAAISFSNLKYWVDISGFDNFKSDEESTTIDYNIPEPIVFYKNEDIQFVILFIRTTQIFQPTHEFSIVQQVKILIKQQDGKFDFEKLWQYIYVIKSFLTLSYFSQAPIQSIRLNRDNARLELFHSWLNSEDDDKKNPNDFLFTYNQIKDNFNEIFGNWVKLNEEIKPVINVLEEAFGNKNIISENRFLNVIQGIETFHRRLRNNDKVPPDDFKKRIQEILISAPSEHKQWLKDKLNFSNEPTLNERLDELFSEMPNELIRHLFPNYLQIIKDAKNSRNYYTHYNHRLERKALKAHHLFYLTEKLKVFLLIILLKEIGFNTNELSATIKEGSYFLFNHLILSFENNPVQE